MVYIALILISFSIIVGFMGVKTICDICLMGMSAEGTLNLKPSTISTISRWVGVIGMSFFGLISALWCRRWKVLKAPECLNSVKTRDYWEGKGLASCLDITDLCLEMIHEFAPKMKYTYYDSFIYPREKKWARPFIVFHHLENESLILSASVGKERGTWANKLSEAGLTLIQYHWLQDCIRKVFSHPLGIRIRLTKKDVEMHKGLLKELFLTCYQQLNREESKIDCSAVDNTNRD
jgi:hypothetical protein